MVKRISTIIIFLVLLVTGCSNPRDQELHNPMGHGSYGDIRGYSFNPKTILTGLDQNDKDIFRLLPDWGMQENVFPSGSFAWQQQDYLKIVTALNWVANQDILEGWSVYRINASRDCADNPIGFDNFIITFFKTVGERYSTRQMEVWPLAKEADWEGGADFPRPFPFGWKSIELGRLKVSVDEVLQLAEAGGGKTVRQAVNNACSISIRLSPNADYDNWDVIYIGNGTTTLFHFSIYPY
jgi:hypothetical protein